MQRNLMSHILDEANHLRHQVNHQKENYRYHHRTDKNRVHHYLFGLCRQFILPFQRFSNIQQHLIQFATVFTDSDQIDKDFARIRAKKLIKTDSDQIVEKQDRKTESNKDIAALNENSGVNFVDQESNSIDLISRDLSPTAEDGMNINKKSIEKSEAQSASLEENTANSEVIDMRIEEQSFISN